MINSKKKGFTIVELVIVIAVVAILAAVLIPTFSNLIKKANLSADQQAIRNMNTAVAVGAADGKYENPSDAIDVLYSSGWNIGKLETHSRGFHYAYNATNNKMYLLDENDNVIYPEETEKSKLWGLYNDSPNAMISGVTKYIAITNIEYGNGFAESFAGTTAYELDLNGYYVNVEGEYTNVTIKNGAYVSGDFSSNSENVKQYTELSKAEIENGGTFTGKVIKGVETDLIGYNVKLVFEDCIFYNSYIQFAGNIEIKNCTFVGGPQGSTKSCLNYNPNQNLDATIKIIGTTFNNVHRAIILNETQYTTTSKVSLEITDCTFNGLDKEYAYIQYVHSRAKVTVSNCTFNSLNQGVGIIRIHSSCEDMSGYANFDENFIFTNNTISSDILIDQYVDMDGITTNDAKALDTALTNKIK